jgi:hypothetical protein
MQCLNNSDKIDSFEIVGVVRCDRGTVPVVCDHHLWIAPLIDTSLFVFVRFEYEVVIE